MKVLDYDQAHDLVRGSRNLYWDGWDIVSWRRNHNGATNQRGLFRKGTWGIATRFPLNDDGTWRVPDKYAN